MLKDMRVMLDCLFGLTPYAVRSRVRTESDLLPFLCRIYGKYAISASTFGQVPLAGVIRCGASVQP